MTRLDLLLVALCSSSLLVLAACPTGETGQQTGSGSIGSGSGDATVSDSGGVDTTSGEGGLCLLHNCDSDADCNGCSEGRNSCYAEDKRCVACDPISGTGCEAGEECTEFGNCVPTGATCPADVGGECNVDEDCAACDPLHQVCDAGACVACRGDAVEACQSTEQCIDNGCVPKCPEACMTDGDCSACGEGTAQPATACHNHRCAECSETNPCPAGDSCSPEGVCSPVCGLPGMVAGTCDGDGDCVGCQGDNDACNAPINGGHGVCGPSASGCSDLGDGVAVLPEPFDAVTNLCSDDADCSGVGIEYNVGALLRDITGIGSIDDANIEYPMNACAAVTVGVGQTSVSCGVCVPCREDDDCMDIDIDMVADDALGPLGGVAAAILLDELFGPEDHLVHMFCQPVAGDYGVCVPCPTVLNDCAGGGGGGSGSCDHDVCTAGNALDPTCGDCAASVCQLDDFCCTHEWDDVCVGHVADTCAGGCDGGGAGCHDQCVAGEAMGDSCNACVSQICAEDPFCCQTEWDEVCVGHVATVCDGACAGSGCGHDECEQGGPLEDGCSDCATEVCAADAFCCMTDWDATCVGEADSICGICTAGGCAHDECQTGGPLDAGCSDCADAICGDDPFCCTDQWDSACVTQATDVAACGC
ncbi:MAG: hypothetical protein IAG13_34775 [Deltaproteobacteria bacterium]|nr:hypothetical protein [Nannocystaceae bacterium]